MSTAPTAHFVFNERAEMLPCSCRVLNCPVCIAAVVGQAEVNAAAELLHRARYTTRADGDPLPEMAVATGEPIAIAGEP